MTKLKNWLVKAASFILNPHLLLCFGLGWIITNGWAYICFGIGSYAKITWLASVSGAYLAFLWLPGTPEKIVTVAIAFFLLKKLFPNDQKTLAELQKLKSKFISEKKKKPQE